MNMAKKLVDRALQVICVVLFSALVLLVIYQVFTRFVLNKPSSFSEEMATYVFVWLVMFGTAYVFGEKGHMAMDFLRVRFPRPLTVATTVLIELLVLAFAALVMVWGGSSSASLAWAQATGSIQVPLGYLYLALPIAGSLIIFYSVHNIVEAIRAGNTPSVGQTVEEVDV